MGEGRGMMGERDGGGRKGRDRLLWREMLANKSLKFTEKFYLLFTLIIIKVPCMIACWNNGKQDIFW